MSFKYYIRRVEGKDIRLDEVTDNWIGWRVTWRKEDGSLNCNGSVVTDYFPIGSKREDASGVYFKEWNYGTYTSDGWLTFLTAVKLEYVGVE